MDKIILINYLENSLIKIQNKQKININTINNIARKYIHEIYNQEDDISDTITKIILRIKDSNKTIINNDVNKEIINQLLLKINQLENKIDNFKCDSSNINWKGPWTTNTQYKKDNIVSYNGSSYIAIRDNTQINFTIGDWQLVASKGEQGDNGLPGNNGSFINSWKDDWNDATDYVRGDIVFYNGSSYIAMHNNRNEEPPNNANWQLVASKGDQGLPGGTIEINNDSKNEELIPSPIHPGQELEPCNAIIKYLIDNQKNDAIKKNIEYNHDYYNREEKNNALHNINLEINGVDAYKITLLQIGRNIKKRYNLKLLNNCLKNRKINLIEVIQPCDIIINWLARLPNIPENTKRQLLNQHLNKNDSSNYDIDISIKNPKSFKEELVKQINKIYRKNRLDKTYTMERLNNCLKNRKIRLNNTKDIKNDYTWVATNNPTGSPNYLLYGHFTNLTTQNGGFYNILAQLNYNTKF